MIVIYCYFKGILICKRVEEEFVKFKLYYGLVLIKIKYW